MKKSKDKISIKLLITNILIIFFAIGYFIHSILLLNNIENILRILIIIILIILGNIKISMIINSIKKRKKIKLLILTASTIIINGALIYLGYNINKIYNTLSNISANNQTYSTSIVTLKDNKINEIQDIKNEKIGILYDKQSIDGYQISQEIIKEKKLTNETIEYTNYLDMINDLLNKKIDMIFLPNNYPILFSNIEGFEHLEDQTKIIYTKDKNVKNKNISKSINEPITILLMGVDSELEEIKNSSFNGDSLILLTFNPNTLNTTILSIPRDTYTNITCFAGERKNKITHAAWYGETCMMNTIEKMFDIDIDYYIKINFKGVVNIIDTLNGIDIDVPYSFCEQNSNREFGKSTIYVKKGYQTLNGEQALALTRNRHPWPQYCSKEWTNYNSNDFIRSQNQQKIIQALLNKIKTINSIDTLYEILNNISKNMETNMSTNTILSFYDIAKDILINSKNNIELSKLIGLERLYLSGYDKTIVDYDTINNTGSKLSLYNFIPYQESIKEISNAMKINLEIIKPEEQKQFTFTINKPYEEQIIGKGNYEETEIELLPSFVGKDVNKIKEYCKEKGIKLNITKTKTISSKLNNQIISQNLPSGMDIEYINKEKGINVTIYEYK